MAADPIFAATPKVWRAESSTANTNRDGTGTITDLVTPGASGCKVDELELVIPGTATAGNVKLFIHNGTNWRLFREVGVTDATPSATVRPWSTRIVFPSLVLPSTHKLGFAPHNAENTVAHAFGGDF